MNDQFTVRAVVIFLGVFALAALGGTTWLIHDHIPTDAIAVLSGAMGAALGGLGTLLASVKVGDGSSAAPAPVATQGLAPAPVLPPSMAGPRPVGDAAP